MAKKSKATEVKGKNPQNLKINEYGVASEDSAQLVDNSGGYQGDQISGRESEVQKVNAKGERLNADGTLYEDWSQADSDGELSKTVGDLTQAAFTIVKNGETYTLIKVMVNPIGGDKARQEVMRENLSKADAEELFKATAAKEIFKTM